MAFRIYVLTSAFTLLLISSVVAQPAINWSYNYGGNSFEEITSLTLAPGGGFVAVGKTSSDNTGVIGEAKSGGSDLFLVRMSADGEKLWDRLLGGTDNENAYDVIVNQEGNYILAGISNSDVGGTKTSQRDAPGPWVSAAYITAFDQSGVNLWQASFGGNGICEASKIFEADNGNYLIAGWTNAPGGGGFTRTVPSNGGGDFWLLEVNPQGQLVREFVYGGDQDERLWGATQLSDGTLLLYGTTRTTTVNGDVSQVGYGSSDMWILNVDQDGNVLSDARFGGSEAENAFFVEQYADGTLFISGQSVSPASGSKTTPALGALDLYCLRYNLATREQIWDRSFGGDQDDNAFTARKNINDYMVMAGNTRSAVRGTSTFAINGDDDSWLIYISPEGELIWDISKGGNRRENLRSIIRSEDGGWYFGGESSSDSFDWRDQAAGGPYGDVNGVNRNNDGWLGKLECNFEVSLSSDVIDLCFSESVTLRNEEVDYLPHTSFIWSTGSTDSTITLSPEQDSIVILQSVSPDACEAADTVLLDVHATPSFDVFNITPESCGGLADGSIYIEPSIDAEGYTVNDEVFSAPMEIDSLTSGDFDITIFSSLDRCNLDTTVSIESANSFSIDLGEEQTHVIGTTITLDPNVISTDSLSYAWTGLPGLCSDCPIPTLRLMQSGVVSLTVTNEEGCIQTSFVNIIGTKDKRVQIPNAISPNNDGVNDRFFVYTTPFVEKLGPLRIFDRWGNMMFVGTEGQILQGEGWNGAFNEKVVQNGVYTYILEVQFIDGEQKVFQGEINVIY